MSRTRRHWIVGISILTVALFSVAGRVAYAEEGLKQEAAPVEGEVGTRAMPRQKPAVQSLMGTHILKEMGAGAILPPSPYPQACIKFNTTGLPQPVPSTHYYSTTAVMPSVNRDPSGNSIPIVSPFVSARENPNATQYENIASPELHLPHGAMIREFSILIVDNSGKQDLLAELSQYNGIGQSGGWRPLSVESGCLPLGANTKIGANNLAIPVDGRSVYRVELGLIPTKAPTASPYAASISVDIITIGYTMQ